MSESEGGSLQPDYEEDFGSVDLMERIEELGKTHPNMAFSYQSGDPGKIIGFDLQTLSLHLSRRESPKMIY